VLITTTCVDWIVVLHIKLTFYKWLRFR